MRGRPKKLKLVCLVQLMPGRGRPVGDLITAEEAADQSRLDLLIRSGEWGYRELEAKVTPDHLALPLRRRVESGWCNVLVPRTPAQQAEDEAAAEARASESRAAKLRNARAKLAEARTTHTTARRRLVAAEAEVNELRGTDEASRKEGEFQAAVTRGVQAIAKELAHPDDTDKEKAAKLEKAKELFQRSDEYRTLYAEYHP